MVSGRYHYLLNGQATKVDESWSIEGELATQCKVSSLRYAPGVEIEVSAQLSGGVVQHFTADWRSDSAKTLSVQYLLEPDRVLVSRRAARSAKQEVIEVRLESVSSQSLLFPLMRIFTGPLIARLLELGGAGTVILPDINDPANTGQLLRPLSTQRRAMLIGDEVLLSPDGVALQCRCVEYIGDQYAAGSRFWLAQDDLLVRYQWQQSDHRQWDVWLQRD